MWMDVNKFFDYGNQIRAMGDAIIAWIRSVVEI